MKKSGYITMSREITEWRWYKKPKTAFLFIHLLISANYESHDFENINIVRGQLVTSIDNLTYQTGLTRKEVRTALEHLKETCDISIDTSRGYSIITINQYDKYASAANNGHGKGTRKAFEGQKYKNNKKEMKKTSYDINELKKIDTLDFVD